MAITFIDDTSVPTDDGTQLGPTVTVDKDAGALASAQLGDLVVLWVQYRAARASGAKIVPFEYGGQGWNIEQDVSQTGLNARWLWCRFNGTWTADPSAARIALNSPSGALALQAVALVFRPTSSAKWWVVNKSTRGVYAAPSSPFTVTAPGVTPTLNNNVTVAILASTDNNTWSNHSGGSWTRTGLPDQWRNSSDTGLSATAAYQIQTTAAATGSFSADQATLGGVAGAYSVYTWAEVDMPSGGPVQTVQFIRAAGETDDGNTTNTSPTLAATVASGNAVIGWTHWETTTDAEISTIRDNQNNDYTPLMRIADTEYDQMWLLFWRPNITNAPDTVTVTLDTAAIFKRTVIHEVQGIASFNLAIGRIWQTADTFSADQPRTPQRTPTLQNTYLFGGCFSPGGLASANDFDNIPGWTISNEFGTDYSYSRVLLSAIPIDMRILVPQGEDCILGWLAFGAAGADITQQPLGVVAEPGQSVTFSVSAVASGGSLSYQWQDNTGGSFANISGQTSSSLVRTASSTGGVGYAVRCQITDSAGTKPSNPAHLLVLTQGLYSPWGAL